MLPPHIFADFVGPILNVLRRNAIHASSLSDRSMPPIVIMTASFGIPYSAVNATGPAVMDIRWERNRFVH